MTNDPAPDPAPDPARPTPDHGGRRAQLLGITVAIIGVVGVVIGGIIGGAYLLTSTAQQSRCSESTSQQSFLREQRQQAYSKFIASETNLRRVVGEFYLDVELSIENEPILVGPMSQQSLDLLLESWEASEEARSNVVAAGRELEDSFEALRLVGSPDPTRLATDAFELHRDFLETIYSNEALGSMGKLYWEPMFLNSTDVDAAQAAAIEEFRRAAQVDLSGSAPGGCN